MISDVSPWTRRAFAAALAVAALVAVAHALRFGGYAQDDAFISFAYARHLVDDGVFAYRIDERAIGYTNFLWVLIAIPAYLVAGAGRLLTVMQGIGTLAAAALAVATGVAARRLGAGRLLAASAALALAGTSALALQARSGLETTLFALLLTSGFLVLLPALAGRGSGMPAVLAFAAAAWTRPEGFGYLALAIGALVLVRGRDRAMTRAIFAAVAAPLLLAGLWLALHGSCIPNTLVAKLSAAYPLGVRLAAGLSYVIDAARGIPVLWLLPLAALALAGAPRSPAHRLALLLALAPWVESLFVGGDAMPGFRFVVPGLPFLLAFAAAGGEALSARVRPAIARTGTLALLLLYALGAQWLAPRGEIAAAETANAARNARLVAGYAEVARAMAPLCRARPELATDVAGAFAYFTDCRVLDTWGLASGEIARRGRAFPGRSFVTFGVVAPEVLLERRPEIIVPYPPVPMAVPWERQQVVAGIFPAGFYVGRAELDGYVRAVIAMPSGRFAFLMCPDAAPQLAPVGGQTVSR